MALVAGLLAVFGTHEAKPVGGRLAGRLGRDRVVAGAHANLYNAFHDVDLLWVVGVGGRVGCEVIVMSDVGNSGSAQE